MLHVLVVVLWRFDIIKLTSDSSLQAGVGNHGTVSTCPILGLMGGLERFMMGAPPVVVLALGGDRDSLKLLNL